MRGFWKGNTSAIVSKGVNNTFLIGYRDMVQEGISDHQENHSQKGILSNFIAPLITLIPVVITYPLEYARTRLANNGLILGRNPQFSGYKDLFKKTWHLEGVHGMYRGLTASLLRMAIHRVTYFGFYDSVRYMKQMSFLEQFMLVNVVTCLAALLSYPFDTARRRMMMTSLEQQQYTNLRDFFRKNITKKSPFRIYQGLSIYLFK